MKLTVSVRELLKTEVKQPLLWKSITSGAIVCLDDLDKDELVCALCIRPSQTQIPEKNSARGTTYQHPMGMGQKWHVVRADFFPCDHEGNELPQAKPPELAQVWRHKGTGAIQFSTPRPTVNGGYGLCLGPSGVIDVPYEARNDWEPAGPCEIIIRQTPD
jgi:hypothetical protein